MTVFIAEQSASIDLFILVDHSVQAWLRFWTMFPILPHFLMPHCELGGGSQKRALGLKTCNLPWISRAYMPFRIQEQLNRRTVWMSVRSGQKPGADDDMAVCIAPAQALGDRKDANHIVMLLNLARDGVKW